ncbi:Uncharacterized protein family UPF0005 containing protein [Aphelenchoides avenae]|nr:Uncharacterized protein family UPF0005 containing protein [Aphelenchus avenae]
MTSGHSKQHPQQDDRGWVPYGDPRAYQPSTGGHYNSDIGFAEDGLLKSEFGFTNASIRAAFVRKVTFIVTLMLGVVTVMVAFPFLHQPTMELVKAHQAYYFVAYIVFFIVYIAMVCCESVRRTSPVNVIFTALLTVSLGFMTMVHASFHEASTVLVALIVTVVVCGAATVFALQTKYDFTSKYGYIFVATLVIFVFGIVAVIAFLVFHVKVLYIAYAGAAALLFTVYLVFDIQLMVGGGKYEISPEEHFYAALQIFIDVVYIFRLILGASK